MRSWTTSEEAFLIANAGKLPKRDICKMLKRPAESVKQKAKALRRKGVNVNLRYFPSTLEECPRCGNLSATVDKTGLCEPCRLRDRLETTEAKAARILPLLSLEDRKTYAKTEAQRGSRFDPLPEPPDLDGMSRLRREYATEKHAKAVEDITIRNLTRVLKAAQRRTERMEEKIPKNANQ